MPIGATVLRVQEGLRIPTGTSKESMNQLSLCLDASPLHQTSIGILWLLALLYDLEILIVFKSSIKIPCVDFGNSDEMIDLCFLRIDCLGCVCIPPCLGIATIIADRSRDKEVGIAPLCYL